MIVLVSSDGAKFPIKKEMADLSGTLEQMAYATTADDEGTEMAVPVSYKKKIVSKLVKWMELYVQNPAASSSAESRPKCAVQTWELRLFRSLSQKRMLGLLNCANFMQVAALMDSGSSYISEKLSMKTVEEARSYLCESNDFTSAEEREIQDKFGWLVDKI